MICPNPVELLETRIAPSTLNLSGSSLNTSVPAVSSEAVTEGLLSALSPEISPDGKSATFVDVDGDVFTVTTSKGTFSAANFTYLGDTATGQGYLQKIDIGFNTFGWKFYGSKITVTVDQVVGDGYADVGFINAWGLDLKQVVVDGDLVRIEAGDGNPSTPAIRLLQIAQLGFHTPEEAGVTDFISTIFGKVNVLEVGSWLDASIFVVSDENKPKFGSIGHVTIQSMTGGSAEHSASLVTAGSIGTIVIQADLTGGTVDGTGLIFCGRKIGSLTVGGSIVGGDGTLSGAVFTDEGGSIGSGVIGGSIEGGTGEFSGGIFTDGRVQSLAINGDIKVGSAFLSGSVLLGAVESLTVAGDLIGGPATGGILVEKTISKLTLGGADGTAGPAYVIVGGPLSGGVAIEKMTVMGSLNGARILAGYDPDLEASNPNTRIGKITIGGDLVATDIVAGIDDVNGVFGDGDDQVPTDDPKPEFLSSIGTIIVSGIVSGTEGGTDQYGILAERIGTVQIGGTVLPLGKKTLDDLQLGTTGDYRLQEFSSFA